MEITIGVLKKVIGDLENKYPNSDSFILATLDFSNDMIKAYSNAKRLLILKGSKSWSEKTFLTVNNMGSHFTGKGKQKDLFLLGYYDSDNKGHFL